MFISKKDILFFYMKSKKKKRSNVRSIIQSLPVEEFFPLFLFMQKDFRWIQTESESFPARRPLAVVRLFLGLPEPREEGGDGLQGHAFALLLSQVLAGLPLVEGLLFDHVLVVKGVEEHPQQI